MFLSIKKTLIKIVLLIAIVKEIYKYINTGESIVTIITSVLSAGHQPVQSPSELSGLPFQDLGCSNALSS